MRTTLKRGMGRGAAVNGNGHPVLPPGALSPITIYRQPEPARRGIWAVVGAVVAWMFVALLMTAGAIGGGYYLFLEQRVEDLVATTPDVVIAQKQLDIPLANEPATALVIGYDKRKGEDASAQSRSDTVMLVRADPNTESISLLSFPRDLIVDVTCPGKPTYRGRINEAYSECGSTGTLQTVRKLTGALGPLPRHGRLPRLPAGRRQRRRRLARHRPALLQRPQRPVRLRRRSTSSRAIRS